MPDAESPRDQVLSRAVPFLREVFGIDAATAVALGSNEDVNVLASAGRGSRVLLKVSHAGASLNALEAQNAALRWLSAVDRLPFEVPRPLASQAGNEVERWVDGVRFARVLTFVEGAQPTPSARVTEGFAASLGRAAGRLATALARFENEDLADGGDWDLRRARRVVGANVELGALLTAAEARTEPVANALRVQATHGDLTGDNVVFDAAGEVVGVIDFGDTGRGWVAAEIAVCACSLLSHDGDALALALDAIAAFDVERPLDDADIRALWPLVVTRAAVLVASALRVLAADPGNAYARAREPLERRMLARAVSLTFDEAEILVRAALGRLAPLPDGVSPMVEGLGDANEVDLSVASSQCDRGAWTVPGHFRQVLTDAWATRHAAITRWGEHRLTGDALTEALPRTLALAIDAAVDPGTAVLAPVDGVIVRGEAVGNARPSVGVRCAGGATAWVRGLDTTLAAGERVARGDVIGRAAHPGEPSVPAIIGIGWCLAPAVEAPGVVAPRAEARWLAACPDPAALLGRVHPQAREAPPSALLARRDRVFAAVQEHYFDDPPRIERGWRHHLVDTTGRAYIDMINNVALVGHAEPRLSDAVARQMERLNTNSRFHYAAVVEFCEALAARAPEGLDVVLLVNSGSEAVDLAMRMARAATGRSDMLALTEAYHGWTLGADAISTSIGDNPQALATRPPWVHLLDAPNAYRGRHRGGDARLYLDDALAVFEGLDARGVALAGMVSEPIFGNGGGILLPDGYLRGVWEAVRQRGGLCVSDEVQVSYGRLGEHFWGFEQQGVIPDVIAVAKAMGNGHPLGAVITTAAIADAFAVEGSFFSSAGGSPVSCAVGSTVLRVIDEDGLQDNARVVGGVLADGLRRLAARHPQLGAVHGMGLYLGVEVVNGGPDHPDARAASEICVDLLDEGVFVQPTGDHKNVLKIKPPLTIDQDAVVRFLAALDGVLERRAARSAM